MTQSVKVIATITTALCFCLSQKNGSWGQTQDDRATHTDRHTHTHTHAHAHFKQYIDHLCHAVDADD